MTAIRTRAGACRMEGVAIHLHGTKGEELVFARGDEPGSTTSREAVARRLPTDQVAGASTSPLASKGPRRVQRHERSIFVIAERLVQIWCSNERDLAELRSLRLKKQRLCAYLSSSDASTALGDACLEKLENAYELHLARLEENRLELSRLLPKLDGKCTASSRPLGPEKAASQLRSWGQSPENRRPNRDSRSTHRSYA